MNIQAEKIELIKLIADVESENIIRKIRNMLSHSKKDTKVEYDGDHSLTRDGMFVSEPALRKLWDNENDEEWAQYLKD